MWFELVPVWRLVQRLVIVQLPVTDLLDRRFASRQHYETTDPVPMVRMVCGDVIGTLCEVCVCRDTKRARD